MQSTNRKRAMIVSTSVILLCMTIIAGMTWALFTDTQTVSNHLQAGDLQITLKRTELTKTTLDASGYLTTLPADKTPVEFTNPTDENVFGIGTDEKIVPGTKYVAQMQIENHSDVAFGYWVEIVCTDKTAGENLAKQLKVTVNAGSDQSGFVGDGLTVRGADGGNVGELAVGATETFTVTVEFLDSAIAGNNVADNNLAQTEELSFDLVVHAVQATKAPTP
jgi:predicted ribosomally synthesized peptide with SipW-like signal peptide